MIPLRFHSIFHEDPGTTLVAGGDGKILHGVGPDRLGRTRGGDDDLDCGGVRRGGNHLPAQCKAVVGIFVIPTEVLSCDTEGHPLDIVAALIDKACDEVHFIAVLGPVRVQPVESIPKALSVWNDLKGWRREISFADRLRDGGTFAERDFRGGKRGDCHPNENEEEGHD